MAIDYSAWEGYRVIWLRIRTGWGGSEAEAPWFEAIEQHCRKLGKLLAWVKLEPGDNNPLRFVQTIAGVINSTLHGTAGPDLIPMDWVELLNQLSELEQPILLALVGYDQIQHPGVHELVAELLEYPPQALQILLICQAAPPVPLPRLRARRALLEVDPVNWQN